MLFFEKLDKALSILGTLDTQAAVVLKNKTNSTLKKNAKNPLCNRIINFIQIIMDEM